MWRDIAKFFDIFGPEARVAFVAPPAQFLSSHPPISLAQFLRSLQLEINIPEMK